MQGQVKRAYERALAARHDRADDQPPVPRGAGDRQARAHRDGDRRRPRLASPRSPSTLRARTRSASCARRHVLIIGAGRDERADRAGARRARRRDDVRRQPPARPRERAGPALRRQRRVASTSCRRELERADIVVASTSSPHAIVGAEELDAVMAARDGPPAAARRPRRAARHRSRVRRAAGRDAAATSTTCRRSCAAHRSVREAEAARAEAIVEEEIQRFAEWLGRAGRAADPRRAARARRRRSSTRVLRRERGALGVARPSATCERVEAIARAVVNRLLHEPTLRAASTTAEQRATRACSSLRELFGLDEARRGAADAARRATLPTDVARRCARRDAR